MFGLGPSELIIIALIIILLFGAKRIPEIGKGIGGAIREFRNVKKELRPDTPRRKQPKRKLKPRKPKNHPPLKARWSTRSWNRSRESKRPWMSKKRQKL